MKTDYTKILLWEDVRVDLFSASAFRVRFSELEGEAFPEAYEIPFCMSDNATFETEVKYAAEGFDRRHYRSVITDKLRIHVRRKDRRIMVENVDGERIYPTIQKPSGMFLNRCIVYDSANFHNERTESSRFAHWFYNDETGLYDTRLDGDKLLDVFFIYAETYAYGYKKFTELVGKEPMLSKKNLGYMQTNHYSANGSQEVLMKTAEVFREKEIPCDTLILDFEWGDAVEKGEIVKWGSKLDWNSDYCTPLSPQEMIAKLDEMHYDVVLIHHGIPDYEGRQNESWVEVTVEAEKWWASIEKLAQDGVAGTWQDTRQTDITNHRIYKGLQKIYPDKRFTFIGNYEMYQDCGWTIDCFVQPVYQKVGGRRYPFGWTGDMSYDRWSEIAYQIEAITNEHGALKGVSYITNDAMLSGDRAMSVRSLQFLCFNSVARCHTPKPWEWRIDKDVLKESMAITNASGGQTSNGKKTVESILALDRQDAEKENAIRECLKLRYRLIPYIYTYMRETYDSGLPLTRPMMISFEDDLDCNENQWRTQYMFGNELLVSPICDGKPTKRVYLPKSCEWIDFYTGKPVANGVVEADATDLLRMPLYVKKGAIIPMAEQNTYVRDGQEEKLYLYIYPDGKSEFTLYEDDGKTLAYQRGEYAFTKFTYDSASKELTVGKAQGSFPNMISERKIIVKLVENGKEHTTELTVNTSEETHVIL